MNKFIHRITRRKEVNKDLSKTGLVRVLNTLHLTLLGVGSTLGVGVYVLAGQVSKDFAGPAVIISFLIAALASVFAGFCYAEFGARVPKAGSAYAYSYVTVGELIAFVMGWNLVLEYLIGAASVTKGLSSYIDELTGGHIRHFLTKLCPIHVNFLGDYPDIFAFAIVFIISVGLAFGVKESSMVNSVCTGINLGIVIFVVFAGSFKADVKNWAIPKYKIPWWFKGGEGGFIPFGVTGIIKGAATCFYGFIGFDCIAAAGEEVKNPQRTIPVAIITSLTIIFLAYFSISTVLTLMVPYYEQNVNAPFTVAFDRMGWVAAKWVVSVGAIFGLFPSLLGSLMPLPRILYAMSKDGLLFRVFGLVSPKYHSPMVGTLFSGFLTGVLASIFNLSQLVNMMSIGTLMAYTIVAACVLILRFRKSAEDVDEDEVESELTLKKLGEQIFNKNRLTKPTTFSSLLVSYMTLLFYILSFAIMSCLVFYGEGLSAKDPLAITILAILVVIALIIVISIKMQPESSKAPFFMVPFVPVIPCISILFNVYLMLMLDAATWIRFGVWIVVGLLIYFSFGMWNSEERMTQIISSKSETSIGTDMTVIN